MSSFRMNVPDANLITYNLLVAGYKWHQRQVAGSLDSDGEASLLLGTQSGAADRLYLAV